MSPDRRQERAVTTPRAHLVIEVATLPPQGETFTLTIDDATLRRQWRADDNLTDWRFSDITSRVHLIPALGGVDLRATVAVRCTAPCIRCLAQLDLDLEDAVQLRFERSEACREVRLSDASLNVLEFDGKTIDLTAWLAEQVLLTIPDLPRCDTEAGRACAGPALSVLEQERPDPRWAALETLRITDDG